MSIVYIIKFIRFIGFLHDKNIDREGDILYIIYYIYYV